MDGPSNLTYTHGSFKILNGSSPIDTIVGVLGQTNAIPHSSDHVAKGDIVVFIDGSGGF